MNIKENILKTIEDLPEDKMFQYADFGLPKEKYPYIATIVYDLIRQKKIVRFKKGFFYKPQAPSEILASLYKDRPTPLNSNEKMKYFLGDGGYLTASCIFNEFKFTNQVNIGSFIIASTQKKAKKIYNGIPVVYVKGYFKATNDNIRVLQLLDCIRFIEIIPACSSSEAVSIFIDRFNELNPEEKSLLINLSFKYPAKVRALLGSILMFIDRKEDALRLKETLKPSSRYWTDVKEKFLPTLTCFYLRTRPYYQVA